MRPWTVLGACSVGLLSALDASARLDDLPLEVKWSAPAECPDPLEFRQEVAAMAMVDELRLPALRATIVIARTQPTRYELTLQTISASETVGVRNFHGQSCRAVFDAAAVTVALILNPNAQTNKQTNSHERSSSRAGASLRPTNPTERSAPDQAVRLAILGDVGLERGLLPHIGPELGLGAGVDLGRLSLWLRVSHGLLQSAVVPTTTSAGANLWLLSATGYGCWDVAQLAPAVRLCAGMDASQMRGRGVGISSPQSGSMEWSSITAGIVFDIPLTGALAIHLSGFGLLPLTRPSAYLEGIGTLHRPALPSERLQLGFLWALR